MLLEGERGVVAGRACGLEDDDRAAARVAQGDPLACLRGLEVDRHDAGRDVEESPEGFHDVPAFTGG